jgi:hypothetical protein
VDPLRYWLTVVFMLAGGAFALAGAIKNWDWFINHPRARPLVTLAGRTGARVIYGILGGLLMLGGLIWLLVGPQALG